MFFFSKPDLVIDLHKFISKESNKLLIVGLSGSGKTTLSRKLCEKYGCGYVNLDDFFFANQQLKRENLTEYKRQRNIFDHEQLTNDEWAIVDGVGILRMEENLTMHLPVIILQTSLVQSSWRGLKRNLTSELTDKSRFQDLLTSFSKNTKTYSKELGAFIEKRLQLARERSEVIEPISSSLVDF